MRSRFEHSGAAGSQVVFGMSQAIQNRLPAWRSAGGDVPFPDPLIIPPSGKIICYLDSDKAYDIKVTAPDGTITEIEDPALEMVQCGCISKDMFEAMREEQDAQREALDSLSDQYSDVIEALKASQQREMEFAQRLQALEEREPEHTVQEYDDAPLQKQIAELSELVSELSERVGELEGREVVENESFEEFLRSERDGRDSDSETLEGLREELQMLMNRTQADDATQREHDRYAELTCWENYILKG